MDQLIEELRWLGFWWVFFFFSLTFLQIQVFRIFFGGSNYIFYFADVAK